MLQKFSLIFSITLISATENSLLDRLLSTQLNIQNEYQQWHLEPQVDQDDMEIGYPSGTIMNEYSLLQVQDNNRPRERISSDKNGSWEIEPNAHHNEDGSPLSDIDIHSHYINHDFPAGRSEVFDRPNEARIVDHVGDSFRFKRSPLEVDPEKSNGVQKRGGRKKRSDGSDRDGSWEINTNVQHDENGNLLSNINIHRHFGNHDFSAGWGEIIEGPNKAKPVWHVGGSFRFRRSHTAVASDEPKRIRDQERREKRSPHDNGKYDSWKFKSNVNMMKMAISYQM
ncbi:hypothetical protein JTB14_037415 [Gonioctena quinquepunctata]|nr:hypothetical protein JTB14_037415 [Gonioctena quinquepunctata]